MQSENAIPVQTSHFNRKGLGYNLLWTEIRLSVTTLAAFRLIIKLKASKASSGHTNGMTASTKEKGRGHSLQEE